MFKVGLSLLGAVFLVLAMAGSSTACNQDDKARLLKDKKCEGCGLAGCDLTNANLGKVDLSGADLSEAKWVNGRTCKEGSIGKCVLD